MSLSGKTRVPILSVLLFLFAALLLRSWLQITLVNNGFQPSIAADLSYLVVPPLLAVLLFPLLRSRRTTVTRLFRNNSLTLAVALHAIAIGLQLRIIYWCQLLVGIALGYHVDPVGLPNPQPRFSLACPDATALFLGLLVTVVLMPFVEEFINRGLIQTSLAHRGPIIAIALAAALFALCHKTSSWGFTFMAGLVLGIQFWKTGTLWASLITHATFNGLALLDWRCLQGTWNPAQDSLPLWAVAVPGMSVLFLAVCGVIFVLTKKIPGSV